MIGAHAYDLSAGWRTYERLNILLNEVGHLIAGRKKIHQIKTSNAVTVVFMYGNKDKLLLRLRYGYVSGCE
ncbi:MAG: hypothetical protein WCA60_01475, partial [Methanoregula sp.]